VSASIRTTSAEDHGAEVGGLAPSGPSALAELSSDELKARLVEAIGKL
jgi:hypothetical protein